MYIFFSIDKKINKLYGLRGLVAAVLFFTNASFVLLLLLLLRISINNIMWCTMLV